MFPKSKRIIDTDLLEEIRQKPCLFCNRSAPSDPHHFRTVKSGGNDTRDNVIPACRECHTEVHKRGLEYMMQKHLHVGKSLNKIGWKLTQGRMRNEK